MDFWVHDIHMQLKYHFTDWPLLSTHPLVLWLHWPYVAAVWWNTRRSWMQQHRRRVFPPLYTFGKEEWVRHFPFSIFITVETHACRVVQMCSTYERIWDVMSKKATGNRPWVDRSSSDTAARDLRNSDQDPRCHHGRSSQGKVHVLNLETKVGHLKQKTKNKNKVQMFLQAQKESTLIKHVETTKKKKWRLSIHPCGLLL